MDGILDTSTEMWRGSCGGATPLGVDVVGELMCPLCARKVYSERLDPVADTELLGCQRGHRFEQRQLSR